MPFYHFLIQNAIPGVFAGVSALLLAAWLRGTPARPIEPRLPGSDGSPAQDTLAAGPPNLNGILTRMDGEAAALEGAWPCFRGPHSSGVSAELTPLARRWDIGGPKVLWSVELGEGYAGATVDRGRVTVLDYDRAQQADALRCFSLADGREIWRYSYPVKVKRNHGMSRTVPAVTEQFAVALGPLGHVTCVDAASGEFRWGLDLVQEFGSEIPQWYAGQCPLVDGGRVILAPAGPEALLAAVECDSGRLAWKTPNPRRWKMTHSSVVPMNSHGRKMYLYCASGGCAAASAETGELLWETDQWRIQIATIPSPVVPDGDRVFLSGGYNSGSLMLQLREENGRIAASVLYRLAPAQFGATQHTPIFHQGFIYGVRPDGELVCLDPDGKTLWASGPRHRFGLGPFLVAGDLLYALNDTGRLSLIEAKPEGFRLLAEAQVLQGHDSWGPMALAGGRLLARDFTRLVCLDVSE
ncbi:MAG: PQQ-binding-like beta-propeller repeat protein [Planctomycetes bacterium]|nr:PQQ-binding-like beta-propeller repeat protein [Planctomycetota bacterium]